MKINKISLSFLLAFILLNKINVFAINSSNRRKTNTKTKHIKFTKDENRELLNLIEKYGISNWKKIAKEMSTNRTAKSCRERYILYLAPGVNNDPWSSEEDALLLKKHAEYGNKWYEIAKFFKGRTYNSVKNRFNLLKRKNRKSIINNLIVNKFVINKEIKDNQVLNKTRNKPISPILNSDNSKNIEQTNSDNLFQDFSFFDIYDDYFDNF